MWLAVLQGEEIRLIHGFSAKRLQPAARASDSHHFGDHGACHEISLPASPSAAPATQTAAAAQRRPRAQQGKAYVHIVTRIQGGGSGGGKNPQVITLKNQVASSLLHLQYDSDQISKAVDSLFHHLGHSAVTALMNGKKESRATATVNAMKQIGLELPRKRLGAVDSQNSSREIQALKKKP